MDYGDAALIGFAHSTVPPLPLLSGDQHFANAARNHRVFATGLAPKNIAN